MSVLETAYERVRRFLRRDLVHVVVWETGCEPEVCTAPWFKWEHYDVVEGELEHISGYPCAREMYYEDGQLKVVGFHDRPDGYTLQEAPVEHLDSSDSYVRAGRER
jgi:hypothetical protein